MSTKPRSDAALKNLSEDRQADIATYLETHSLAQTAEWLKDDGIKTSLRALSEFRSWYLLRTQLAENHSTVETLLAEFKKENPATSPEKVQAMGQAFFSAMAMQKQDIKPWFLAQQLELKKQAQALDREKFTESRKSDQDRALERCLEEARAFPEVQDLFKAAFTALKKAKGKS